VSEASLGDRAPLHAKSWRRHSVRWGRGGGISQTWCLRVRRCVC